ncbi:hypothetical protein N4G58_00540 [Edwardsiella piscicida]|nr:hypothetical protein N4G58_00540 [Edwardsiella piscicida]
MVLIIGFSPLFHPLIKLDVTTAMLISTVVALLFEFVRLRSARAVLDSFMLFLREWGASLCWWSR